MTKRTTDWISFQTPEGESRIGSPAFIKQLLGVDKMEAHIRNAASRILSLERKVHTLESPQRQKEVLELLFEEENSRMFTWLSNRVRNLDREDITVLVNIGHISTEKSGRNTMYYLSSRDTHEKRST